MALGVIVVIFGTLGYNFTEESFRPLGMVMVVGFFVFAITAILLIINSVYAHNRLVDQRAIQKTQQLKVLQNSAIIILEK